MGEPRIVTNSARLGHRMVYYFYFAPNFKDLFVVYNGYMTYIVNGKPVGNDPASIERSDSYMEFFNKVGNSVDNIKVINNFLTKEEIEYVLSGIETRPFVRFAAQKDHEGNALNYMQRYNGLEDKYNLVSRVKEEIYRIYGLEKEKIKEKETYLSVVEWTEGSYLTLHVDDLGYVTDNHLPVHIYLNDDYEGGELNFETFGLSIRPKKGDMIVFPGNMHYPHELTKILSGTRYTLAVWFTIL